MVRSIVSIAITDFGKIVTIKKPTKTINSSGQMNLDYSTTTDTEATLCVIKMKLDNTQAKVGIISDFPAYLLAETTEDVEDYDLIVTPQETFQVKNSQLKADNITQRVKTEPAYLYADLTYFDHDTVLE